MSRRTKGVDHVDEIQGSRESKRRAKLILKTITGELSVREAREQLGVGPTQFANLRRQALAGMVNSLRPQPVGRPPRPTVVTPNELELQQRLAEIERENRLLQAQVEVAALRRGREGPRSKKSRTETAAAAAAPRPDGGGRAVPGPRAIAAARPPAQGSLDAAADGAAGAAPAAP
jgi:transposase-like protein